MQPRNAAERKKRIITFAGLYAASVIVMLFIFSAFGGHFSSNDQKALVTHSEKQPAEGNNVLQADSVLHARLQLLQQSDELVWLSGDTATALKKTDTLQLNKLYELSLRAAIDSIEQSGVVYAGENAIAFKTMLSSFKGIINERQEKKNISGFVPAKNMAAPSQQEIVQWKNELERKEEELTRLQATVKNLQASSVDIIKPGTDEAQKGETALLKTAFADQQNEYNDLKAKYNRLKTENNNMAAQVVEYKKIAAAQAENITNIAENKINTLQEKVQELNADMYFTRIDCNLARADAKQLISNAKQRKELLSESLSMLNNLAASGDAGTQKKAKEKIARLNQIATTLHD